MQVTLELPDDLIRMFGDSPAGLSRAAMEALALDGIRTGRISEAQARRILGISSRYEMDGFLKAHGLMLPMTAADVERDARTAAVFRRQ